MKTLVEAYFRLVKTVIVACLALMVLLVFTNVVLRYGFGKGITVSDEVSRWLFVYMAFLGAIVAVRERLHLGVDILVIRMTPGLQRSCALVSHLLMLWACWLIFEGSWIQTGINWASRAPSTGLSMGLLYASGLFFSASAGAILLYETWLLLTGKTPPSELNADASTGDAEHSS
ncbi:MAG: TRAP transporter small permease [Burkholderiaceae bacterium]